MGADQVDEAVAVRAQEHAVAGPGRKGRMVEQQGADARHPQGAGQAAAASDQKARLRQRRLKLAQGTVRREGHVPAEHVLQGPGIGEQAPQKDPAMGGGGRRREAVAPAGEIPQQGQARAVLPREALAIGHGPRGPALRGAGPAWPRARPWRWRSGPCPKEPDC